VRSRKRETTPVRRPSIETDVTIRPAVLGWYLVVSQVLALVVIVVGGILGSSFYTAKRQIRADADSAIRRLAKGLPILAPDGRYLWSIDTTTPASPPPADTVRRPPCC
jgi:hypothetical protein